MQIKEYICQSRAILAKEVVMHEKIEDIEKMKKFVD